MEAGKRTINDIFNGSRILEIPFFQRVYVWKEEQWARFLEDLEQLCRTKEPYFMGAIILKQQLTSASDLVGDKRLLVDGQQRMTTMTVLLKVLSLKATDVDEHYFNWRFMVKNSLGLSPALKHDHNDETAYNRIMSLSSLEELEKMGDSDQVTGVYRYFKEHADPEKLNYGVICDKVYFVGIDLSYDEDEQQIFDTINSLGVRLTTAELLKNYFFGRNDLASYEKNWLAVFEKDDETKAFWNREVTTGRMKRKLIDLFFDAFLKIKIQDCKYAINSDEKKNYVKVDRLFESYKTFIRNHMGGNKAALVEEIREYADVFHSRISNKVLWETLPADDGLKRISLIMFGMDTMTILPYVLYVEKNVPEQSIRNELYAFLESYIMRRMVTRRSTKNYNRLFSEKLISNAALTRETLRGMLVDEEEDPSDQMPSDEELREEFHHAELINKYAAGVLYMIESRIRNEKKHGTKLFGFKEYSLEHMLPKKWTNKWKTPEMTDEEVRERNRILLTLGNLTIIRFALNASIRDETWDIKKKGVGSRGGLIKYADGIETVSNALQCDMWNEAKIFERAEYLADEAVAIWAQ